MGSYYLRFDDLRFTIFLFASQAWLAAERAFLDYLDEFVEGVEGRAVFVVTGA